MSRESKFQRKLRLSCARTVYRLIQRKFQAGDDWLWNCTCYPFDIPSWEQIWKGFRLWDGSLSWNRLNDEIWDDIKLAVKELAKEPR